jgi:hypothetical protein
MPTRAYAAAFAALGAVLAQASVPAGEAGIDEHIKRLCLLEPGTPLLLREGKKTFRGIFEGCDEEDGRVRVTVRVEQNLLRKLPLELADRLEVAPVKKITLPKRQIGSDAERPGPLLETFLGVAAAEQFIGKTRLECLILGNASRLCDEIEGVTLGLLHGRVTGTLQEILRVQRFLPGIVPYRTDVAPVQRESSAKVSQYPAPPLVVFDSATGFLKWRDHWRRSHWIVILDRTDPSFGEAADALNQEFVENRIDEVTDIPIVPSGLEAMAYEEVCR